MRPCGGLVCIEIRRRRYNSLFQGIQRYQILPDNLDFFRREIGQTIFECSVCLKEAPGLKSRDAGAKGGISAKAPHIDTLRIAQGQTGETRGSRQELVLPQSDAACPQQIKFLQTINLLAGAPVMMMTMVIDESIGKNKAEAASFSSRIGRRQWRLLPASNH